MKLVVVIVIVFLLVIGIGMFWTVTMHNQALLSHSVPTTSMKVIGWIPNWDQKNAVASYITHAKSINYVSVFWYRIDAEGNLTTYQATQEDLSLITLAHRNKSKIFALIANLPDYAEQKDWDAGRVQKVIGSEPARQKHIADIMNLVTTKGFDGVDIDYEALKNSQRQDFTTFIQELSQKLHEKGKLLGVAVYPPSANEDQSYGAGAQDIEKLATSADQLYVMTYLEHTLSSGPGPLGSMSWIEKSIRYAIDTLHIPKEKIFLGIGLMGIAWRQDPDGSVVGDRDDMTFQEIQSIALSHNISPSWDQNSQSPHITFTDQNGKHILWYENSSSVAKRIAFAKSANLSGIAFWRLGGEDDALWQYVP